MIMSATTSPDGGGVPAQRRQRPGRSLGACIHQNLGAAIGSWRQVVLLPGSACPAMTRRHSDLLVAAVARRLSHGPRPGRPERWQHTRRPQCLASRPYLQGVLVAAGITARVLRHGSSGGMINMAWARRCILELMLAALHPRPGRRPPVDPSCGDASGILAHGGIAQVLMGLPRWARRWPSPKFLPWARWLGTHSEDRRGLQCFNLAARDLDAGDVPHAFSRQHLSAFTMSTLRRGHDERAVGSVYGGKTWVLILGVFVSCTCDPGSACTCPCCWRRGRLAARNSPARVRGATATRDRGVDGGRLAMLAVRFSSGAPTPGAGRRCLPQRITFQADGVGSVRRWQDRHRQL